VVFSEQWERLRSSPLAARVTRYTLGSVVALTTSVVVFALLLLLGVNTTVDSVAAFIAGAVPNWILNRRWAWRMEGKVAFGREIFGYTVISIVALVLSSLATGWTHHQVQSLPSNYGLRVTLVTLSYVFVQAVLFAAKFVVYEHWVFAGRSRIRAALRSRRQVWTAARANRTP
jgi:putative flippase GtrA